MESAAHRDRQSQVVASFTPVSLSCITPRIVAEGVSSSILEHELRPCTLRYPDSSSSLYQPRCRRLYETLVLSSVFTRILSFSSSIGCTPSPGREMPATVLHSIRQVSVDFDAGYSKITKDKIVIVSLASIAQSNTRDRCKSRESV